MGPLEAVRGVLRQYATFRGRARRSEFWWFTLFTVVLSLLATAVDVALFDRQWTDTGPVSGVISLALLVPSLAVSWRRLHDIGRSGLWNLLFFAVVIGWVVLLVFDVTDSQQGANRFGPSPKDPAGAGGYGPAAIR